MGLHLACRDTGVDCDFVVHADSMEELMEKAVKHGKEVHGYTEEQLKDPKMMAAVKAAIKEE